MLFSRVSTRCSSRSFCSIKKKSGVDFTTLVHCKKEYEMLTKGQLTKKLECVQIKNQCLGRVVEGLFLSKAGPKRGCLSYLIELKEIFHTSDVYYHIIDYQI